MPKTKSTTEDAMAPMIAVVSAQVRADVLSALRPFMEHLGRASEALAEVLGDGSGKVKPKRGRPVGSGKKAGAKPGPKKAGGTRTRIKAEAWQAAIRSILKEKGPLSRSDLRDQILKLPAFKGKNEGTVYNGIPVQAEKMKDVTVKEGGIYGLKGGAMSGEKKKPKAAKPAEE
ncbi:hypothetical protein HY256_11960 [Candidatus Sumerlaeota bacterium]|nr:hypothetical protein [Candidatus Sumerlaeota bacterium]